MNSDFSLARDAFGKLVFTNADGIVEEGVAPVRAFPITAPDAGLALLSADGREVAWIADLATLPEATARLIEQELAAREFVPQILAIHEVSSLVTPSTWRVATDRGETSFVLKGEEEIRRLPGGMLLIADSIGIQYLIRDTQVLDRISRRILDRFL